MKRILFLSLLSASLFASSFNICGENVSLNTKYKFKWKQETPHLYTNFSKKENCKIETDKDNKIVKIYKHIDTLYGPVKLPNRMNNKPFRRALFILYKKDNSIQNKMVSNYAEFERVFDTKSSRMKVLQAAYKDKSEYIAVTTICKFKGLKCSTDIEYGILKKEK